MLTQNIPIEIVRRCFAEEVRFVARLRSMALAEAFATVPREDYCGNGPWQSQKVMSGYAFTETADPRELYHDALIAIDPARNLNNGHPSSLAGWIDLLELCPGHRVLHIGCGLGYYTAIMAHVVGTTGQVIAVDVDPDLASRATTNLAPLANVAVVCADGISYDPGHKVDAIVMNAGVTHPQGLWLDLLADDGRLVVPITMIMPNLEAGSGQMLLVHRVPNHLEAIFVSPVSIYSSPSGRDAAFNGMLMQRFRDTMLGKLPTVQSLRRDAHTADETCWLHGSDFCLSTRCDKLT